MRARTAQQCHRCVVLMDGKEGLQGGDGRGSHSGFCPSLPVRVQVDLSQAEWAAQHAFG